MMNKDNSNAVLRVSARMALAMGIFLPVLETIRRSNQILHLQYFIQWFDDYILGAILLIAAIRVLNGKPFASLLLLVAWSMTVGVLLMSFLFQLNVYLGIGEEAGIFSTHVVAFVKALLVTYTLIGLLKSWQGVKSSIMT